MSQFCLKIIALIAMTIDHVGLVFGMEGWNLLPLDSSVLRAIGRIAFPLFAFCLAQGWHKTHDRKQYFQNLAFGALASQIPFSMAFDSQNLTTAHSAESLFVFSWPYLFCATVAAWAYWRFVLHKRYEHSLILVVIAALVPGFQWEIKGYWILSENLNVFYTFLMAFFCLYILAHRFEFEKEERLGILIATPVLLVAYGLPADYGTGLLGIVLVAGLCILEKKEQQILFLLLWSCFYYGLLVGNPISVLSCASAGIFILLYNPDVRGRFRAKKLFYGYYPIHLLILGLINAGLQCRILF